MRSLSGTLETDQKASGKKVLVKIVLTQGANTYTYTKERILDIVRDEQPYKQESTVMLQNDDGALNDINFMGYKGVISRGITTSAGDVYSPCAPLWVVPRIKESTPTKLDIVLRLIGIPDVMAEDRASDSYAPTTSDTDTVKALIRQIAGDTGVTMLSVFNHCTSYDIVFDSEDSLIDTYQPQDEFRIYTNGSRLAAIRRLLDFTKCVMRAEDDGKLHISEPTISGVSYDYEWKFKVAGEHTFFSKALIDSLVIPNKIFVSSRKDDSPQYAGNASDATSFALLPFPQYVNTRLQSNAQATSIATAVQSKYQLHSQVGAIEAPMNVGSEVFDYVKVTDSRQGDSRVGNIGSIHWHWNRDKRIWKDTIKFGGWLSVRGLASDLSVYPDGLSQRFEEIFVENLYAQYIYAQMLDVDYLSAITAQIGLLTAGEIRIGTGVLDPTGTATGGSQTTLEDSGASWVTDEWIGEDLRVVIGGVAYTREISSNTGTELTIVALPGGVVVASGNSYYLGVIAVASGDEYFIKSLGLQTATGGSTTTIVDSGEGWTTDEHAGKPVYILKNGYRYERTITSNTSDTLTFPVLPDYVPFNGFRLWADSGLGRIAGYKEGVLQFYTGSDGILYAGGGNVLLDASGIKIIDQYLNFRSGSDIANYIWVSATGFHIQAGNEHIHLQPASGKVIKIYKDVIPTGAYNLGTDADKWQEGHIKKAYHSSRLQIPVGADMYD